jgi:Transmembrane secretion effector
VIQAQERPDGGQPSAWTPLRNRVYRELFIAQFVSNIGTWMQSVAAQWFLVEKHSTADIVALVQTASLGPTLLLGLFAGALADLFDRRRFLIFMQSYAVLVTVRYRVSAENFQDFVEAMSAVRRSRLRTGGHSWRLYHDVEHSDTIIERFTVASWSEFERQYTERWLEYDHEGLTKAVAYTIDNTRRRGYYLALRVPR